MNSAFLNTVVKDSFNLFEYYRHGPIVMSKLRPGFIFQACIDASLEEKGIYSVENGIGDHCLPEMGLAVQLKTTCQKNPPYHITFCRSSPKARTVKAQKLLRISDVENRIQDMLGETGTRRLVLLYVNLTLSTSKQFLLYDENGVVGDWLKPENVTAPPKQTHFWVRNDKMKLWV
jgi:hypothetical protein